MGRPLRLAPGGYVYHVLNRANGRMVLFRKDADYATIASQPPSPPPSWQQVLPWFPPDIETLIVVRGAQPPASRDSAPSWVSVLGGSASAWHRLPDLEGLRDSLKPTELLLAVEGSRRFRGPDTPSSTGAYGYEGCHVTVFSGQGVSRLDTFFGSAEKKSRDVLNLEGRRVLHRTHRSNGDGKDTFLARPRPDVLIVATDRGFLEETLKRIDGPAQRRAMPESSAAWAHLDVAAPAWAIHLEPAARKEGPRTGPLEGQGVVLTFMVPPEKPRLCRMREVGTGEAILKKLAKEYPIQAVREVSRGVMEGVLELRPSGGEKDRLLLLVVPFCLGHGFNF